MDLSHLSWLFHIVGGLDIGLISSFIRAVIIKKKRKNKGPNVGRDPRKGESVLAPRPKQQNENKKESGRGWTLATTPFLNLFFY